MATAIRTRHHQDDTDGEDIICIYLGGPGDYVKVNVTELDTDELRELAVSLRQTATDLKVLIVERRAAV